MLSYQKLVSGFSFDVATEDKPLWRLFKAIVELCPCNRLVVINFTEAANSENLAVISIYPSSVISSDYWR